jgi:hypothetical protein
LKAGKQSKKDKILELLDKNKDKIKGKTSKQIAQMLGTTESYIYKVRSIDKLGLLTSSGSDTLKDKPVPVISDVEQADRQRKPKSKSDLLSPMIPEIRKAFFRWLGDRKPIVDFVKRTGVDGRVIEEELQVYRRLQDADPFELQENILRTIGYEEGEINSITAAAHDTLLSNTSLMELMERRMEKQLKLKAQDMVVRYMTKNIVLPLGFSRPKCSKCKNDVYGVLVYTRDIINVDAEDITEELSTTYVCFACRI